MCAGVQDIEVVGDTVWAACMTDGTVVGLDPQSLEVTSTVEVAGDPDGLAPGSGADLLVSLQDGPGLAVVDTAAGTSEQVWTGTSGRLLDKANTDVVERDGTAFVSDYLGDAVRVGTPRPGRRVEEERCRPSGRPARCGCVGWS